MTSAEKQRLYNITHREEVNARQRDYNKKHRQKINARQSAYNKKYRMEINKKARELAQNHRDINRARSRKYYQENRQKILDQKRNRKMAKCPICKDIDLQLMADGITKFCGRCCTTFRKGRALGIMRIPFHWKS